MNDHPAPPPNISLRLPKTLTFLKAAEAGEVEVTIRAKQLTAKEVEELRREVNFAVLASERFRRAQQGWKKKWDDDSV